MYSKGKKKALEALQSSLESGEITLFEFNTNNITENYVKNPAESLRKMLDPLNTSITDLIHQERSESERV